MNEEDRQHGLTSDEWLELLDREAWRKAIENTLWDIATRADLHAEIRLTAVNLWYQAVVREVLEPSPAYPVLARNVALSTIGSMRRRSWWRRWRARGRENLALEQLEGCRWLIHVVAGLRARRAYALLERQHANGHLLS